MPSNFYPASVVLFKLHRSMVSHIQVLAIPSSTMNNTKYLDLSGNIDVAIISLHSEKTRLKSFMMINMITILVNDSYVKKPVSA